MLKKWKCVGMCSKFSLKYVGSHKNSEIVDFKMLIISSLCMSLGVKFLFGDFTLVLAPAFSFEP